MGMSKDGGPAFPQSVSSSEGPTCSFDFVDGSGMSLRDHFAGMAMQGFCLQATGQYDKGPCNAAIVERSYVIADLMLAEREKGGET